MSRFPKQCITFTDIIRVMMIVLMHFLKLFIVMVRKAIIVSEMAVRRDSHVNRIASDLSS